MLYGEYEHSIDRKGRIIVPAKCRQALKDQQVTSLFLTRGLDVCLFLFPEPEWRLVEGKFKHASFTKSETRRFNRMLFSGAVEVTLDGLGRLLIPKGLKEFAQIKQDVVIIGVSSRMEVWAKEQWQAFYESSRQNFEQVAECVLLE